MKHSGKVSGRRSVYGVGFAGSVLLALAVFALRSSGQDASTAAARPHGINVANMDRAVTPGDDFFEYANGSWIKRTEIPPDRGRVGIGSELAEMSTARVRGLIEEAGKANAPAGSGTRRIAEL